MQTAFDQGPPGSTPPSIPNCAQVGVKCESELIDPTVVDNNTLEIVFTDDGGPRLGSYAPSAFLNSQQQLGVGLSATSGWPQNYVDSYGGSASLNAQVLITIALPTGLPPGCYTVLVTTSDTDGPDTDQWPWPITVAADGTVATVATASECGSVVVVVDSDDSGEVDGLDSAAGGVSRTGTPNDVIVHERRLSASGHRGAAAIRLDSTSRARRR